MNKFHSQILWFHKLHTNKSTRQLRCVFARSNLFGIFALSHSKKKIGVIIVNKAQSLAGTILFCQTNGMERVGEREKKRCDALGYNDEFELQLIDVMPNPHPVSTFAVYCIIG